MDERESYMRDYPFTEEVPFSRRLQMSNAAAALFVLMVRGERNHGLLETEYSDSDDSWHYLFTDKGADVAARMGLDPRIDASLYMFSLLLAWIDPEIPTICESHVIAGEWADRRLPLSLDDAVQILQEELNG